MELGEKMKQISWGPNFDQSHTLLAIHLFAFDSAHSSCHLLFFAFMCGTVFVPQSI